MALTINISPEELVQIETLMSLFEAHVELFKGDIERLNKHLNVFNDRFKEMSELRKEIRKLLNRDGE